jgi:hypothetical protein
MALRQIQAKLGNQIRKMLYGRLFNQSSKYRCAVMSSIPRASRCRANTGAAKTDRLDTELLMAAFLGWLRVLPGSLFFAAI